MIFLSPLTILLSKLYPFSKAALSLTPNILPVSEKPLSSTSLIISSNGGRSTFLLQDVHLRYFHWLKYQLSNPYLCIFLLSIVSEFQKSSYQ